MIGTRIIQPGIRQEVTAFGYSVNLTNTVPVTVTYDTDTHSIKFEAATPVKFYSLEPSLTHWSQQK